MKKDKIELLSPAGNMESLKAAVKAGADAVYIGGKFFGARSSSKNFTPKELEEAIRYCHIRGVKVYVTVNILVLNEEINKLLGYLKKLYSMDVDAVIVQDLGVLALIKKHFKDFECHASTQMSIHNSFGALAVKNMGIDRVVAAREMELDEIKKIVSNEGPPVEVFIHGALCISYSGQCLISSVIGGRSGNRGTCAQPCRRQYELIEKTSAGEAVLDKGYLLSTKDLCSAESLDEIAASGVSSLKIEGRMKRPEYVFAVTRFYRDALLMIENGQTKPCKPSGIKELKQIFNRKFTKGFIMNENRGGLVNSESPGNRGIFLGSAKADPNGKILISLNEPLAFGDGIEFRRGVESFGCRMDSRIWTGDESKSKQAGDSVEIENKWRMRGVYEAYKTYDFVFERRLTATMNRDDIKVPLRMEVRASLGEPFRISLIDSGGRRQDVISEYIVEKAANRPTDRNVMKEKLERLGATAYRISHSEYRIDDEIYVPVSVLNDARRKATDRMDKARTVCYPERKPVEILSEEKSSLEAFAQERKLSVSASTLKQVEAALGEGADRVYYRNNENLENALSMSDRVVYSPFKISGDGEISDMLRIIEKLGIKEAQIGNLGQMWALKDSGIGMHVDFSLNVTNDHSLRFLEETFTRLETVCISPELNLKQIRNFSPSKAVKEMVVYGRLPVMTLKHCLLNKSFGICLEKECESKKLSLRDAKGYEFPLRVNNCRSEIFNSVGILTAIRLLESPPENIGYWRMELCEEDFDTASRLIRFHKRAIKDGDVDWQYLDKLKQSEYTRGHFFKNGI